MYDNDISEQAPMSVDRVLLARFVAGEASSAEAAAVERWLAEAPEHGVELAEFRRIWHQRGDTISWSTNGPCLTGKKTGGLYGKQNCPLMRPGDDCYVGEPGHLITLEYGEIKLEPLGKVNEFRPVTAFNQYTKTYRRVGDPKRLVYSIHER